MRITAIETIHLRRGITVHAGPIQWLWVRIHTDSGLTGLGETYPHPEAEKAVVHRSLAPVLLGRDPSQIDRLWADMLQAVSFSGWAGAEMRAISAVDIALWDLAGKVANLPVYQLLGGASRAAVRTYNTCYDHIDFLTEPVRLASELAKSGIHAMKIWPFDPMAKETGGQYITPDQIRRGIEPLRLIREEFGDSMEVAMEFHGYWNLPSAIRIAQALEPFAPMWLEEMLPQDNLAAYQGAGGGHAPAPLLERAADDPLRIPRADGEPRGAHRDAGYLLVRRHFGSEEDRHDGGDSLSAGGAA
jgi:galactonate dehydratase